MQCHCGTDVRWDNDEESRIGGDWVKMG
jgi:hypothetical protein